MPTFTCPIESGTFETMNVRVTDDGAGHIIFKSKDQCPHCDMYGHIAPGTEAELKAMR